MVPFPIYNIKHKDRGLPKKEGICTEALIVLGAVAFKSVRALKAGEFLRGRALSEESQLKNVTFDKINF